jgi:hypothetical protein
MMVETALRRCRVCDRPLVQRVDEPGHAFRQRRSCGRACQGKPTPPTHFPGAEVEDPDEAPPRCDRCGGPWKIVAVGLQCATCPRELVVAAALRVAWSW